MSFYNALLNTPTRLPLQAANVAPALRSVADRYGALRRSFFDIDVSSSGALGAMQVCTAGRGPLEVILFSLTLFVNIPADYQVPSPFLTHADFVHYRFAGDRPPVPESTARRNGHGRAGACGSHRTRRRHHRRKRMRWLTSSLVMAIQLETLDWDARPFPSFCVHLQVVRFLPSLSGRGYAPVSFSHLSPTHSH
jgi:hypothetical protein